MNIDGDYWKRQDEARRQKEGVCSEEFILRNANCNIAQTCYKIKKALTQAEPSIGFNATECQISLTTQLGIVNFAYIKILRPKWRLR